MHVLILAFIMCYERQLRVCVRMLMVHAKMRKAEKA